MTSTADRCLTEFESATGHSRHFGRRPTTSRLLLETDVVRAARHVSNGPEAAEISMLTVVHVAALEGH